MIEGTYNFIQSNPVVRNWGYLENWKSTAPVMACA